MNIIDPLVRNLIKPLVRVITKQIERRYVKLFPIEELLKKNIKKETDYPFKRLSEINIIRTNNIVTTFWAKTGTILGIIITLISLLLTVMLALYIPFPISNKASYQLVFFVSFFLMVLLIYYLIINIIPVLIRRIVFHLPSNEYAEISLNSLNDSQMLTLLALKMWSLCNDFILSVNVPKLLIDLSKKGPEEKLKYFTDNKMKIEDVVDEFSSRINSYHANYTKELNNTIALMQLASLKLSIKERELLNHILKFSPYIFKKRVESLRSNTSTLKYIISSNSAGNENLRSSFFSNLSEIVRIKNGVVENSMRSLKQIILYKDIHKYLIGMSSIVSTSGSLSVFCEGIGYALANRIDNIESPNKKLDKKIDVCIEKFKSILHRSKAHYGMDLLILLENYCKERFKKNSSMYKIPEGLYRIKYPKRIQKTSLENFFINKSGEQIINELQSDIYQLRDSMLRGYPPAIKSINNKFQNKVKALRTDGKIYFVLFGYSRIVRNVLRNSSHNIYDKNIITFVIKEETQQMIDTQIFRFELNDEKPYNNIRKTFTASDDFFLGLINPSDTVVFIGGAEAYDKNENKLFHTNNYQKRVNNLIVTIKEKKKIDIEIWIIAGSYKCFEKFPNEESLFGNEFYSDHYDKIDLYDLDKYKELIELISNE